MSGQITAVVLVLAGLGGVVLVGLGASAGRRVERVSRRVGRMRVAGSSGAHVVAVATVVAAAQWAVLTWVSHPVVVATAFVVPALLAGATVARLFAVAEVIREPRRGGRR